MEGWFGTALWRGEKKQGDHVRWLSSRGRGCEPPGTFHLTQADQAGVEEGQPSLLSRPALGIQGPARGREGPGQN